MTRFRQLGAVAIAVATFTGVMGAAAPAAQATTVRPFHAVCDPSASYHVTSHSNHFVARSKAVYLTNSSSHNASQTLTISASGTVSFSLSGSVTAEESAIIAGVKETVTATATASLTVGGSYAVTATAGPHETVGAEFGVWRVETTGTYATVNSYCTVAKKTVTAYTPYRIGSYVFNA